MCNTTPEVKGIATAASGVAFTALISIIGWVATPEIIAGIAKKVNSFALALVVVDKAKLYLFIVHCSRRGKIRLESLAGTYISNLYRFLHIQLY